MNARLLFAGIAMIAILATSAQADVIFDITKITCHRAFFIGKTVLSAHSMALWLSGYYNGQHGKTALDMTTLEQQARRIEHYCRAHRDETLGKAAEAVFGTEH